MTQTIEQLTARVRELEAENAMIREKLLPYPKLAHNTGFFHLQEFFEEVLSLPASTEALDEYVAEKVKEAVEELTRAINMIGHPDNINH